MANMFLGPLYVLFRRSKRVGVRLDGAELSLSPEEALVAVGASRMVDFKLNVPVRPLV
jgi:allophanate hydrolase subunit 2